MLKILSEQASVFSLFLSELRDVHIQKDPFRFRRNLERIGEIFAYEISRELRYIPCEVETPLGIASALKLAEEVVIASVLRAGLPLHHGLLQFFDKAQNGFIAAYRKHHKDNSFEIRLEYVSSPLLTGKTLILCDPMLATGQSMVESYRALSERMGRPEITHVVAVVASEEGYNYARRHMPENTMFWLGALDPELNAKSYIVPGLGDAGDLAYGQKD
ncbi:MAG: uracil phosphoribosyltransferase [Flavobacteriales bacterium]|nr:uracil phosphoribosyltransferase [Flavobacteriales bacterium]